MPAPSSANNPSANPNNPVVNSQAGVVVSQIAAPRNSSKLGSSEKDGVQVPKRVERPFEGQKTSGEEKPSAARKGGPHPESEAQKLDIEA